MAYTRPYSRQCSTFHVTTASECLSIMYCQYKWFSSTNAICSRRRLCLNWEYISLPDALDWRTIRDVSSSSSRRNTADGCVRHRLQLVWPKRAATTVKPLVYTATTSTQLYTHKQLVCILVRWLRTRKLVHLHWKAVCCIYCRNKEPQIPVRRRSTGKTAPIPSMKTAEKWR